MAKLVAATARDTRETELPLRENDADARYHVQRTVPVPL
jgi:hypothetical protein